MENTGSILAELLTMKSLSAIADQATKYCLSAFSVTSSKAIESKGGRGGLESWNTTNKVSLNKESAETVLVRKQPLYMSTHAIQRLLIHLKNN